ncbi:hypothetical protein BDZ89DRAFT_1055971 [Hymenopellis radicata]|nr:hypothetical protein BDZ89DRAFT_1055971 [Hymenopellis radicata]
MANAEKLKALGTQKYKQGNFKEAISLYKQASELEPTVPVYLSNLSAAQFEDGQYPAACKTMQKVLDMLPADDTSLRPKIDVRLGKAASFLHHGEIESDLFEIFFGCDIPRSNALQRQYAAKPDIRANLVNKRLSSIPRYRHCPKDVLEYYVVGHDPTNSILRSQATQPEDHDCPETLHMKIPKSGKAFEFSALFCGIGDARHMYGSLMDLGQDLSGPPPKDLKVHFTTVDIHPAALARDLVIMFALQELATLQDTGTPRAKHLLVMLHYVYWASVMPPLAARILDEFLHRVHEQVSKAAKAGSALDLDWLYVEPNSCEKICERLEWWLSDKARTAVPFNEMLTAETDIHGDILSKVGAADRAELMARKKDERNQFIDTLLLPEVIEVTKRAAVQEGGTLEEYIESFRAMSDEEFQRMTSVTNDSPLCAAMERTVYSKLRVLVPPAGCEEPKALDELIFKPIRNQDWKNIPSSEMLTKAFKNQIRNRWVINVTRLAADWIHERDRVEQDPFKTCTAFFPEGLERLANSRNSGGLYSISAGFFSYTAIGLKKLRGHLKIEMILGDGYAILDDIRLKTLTRSQDFPVLFDRIHASNVPDYIGGYLANFTTAIPLLKSHDQAYFTCCNLLNSGSWEGGLTRKDLHALSLSSQIYTYTGALLDETSSAFGVALNGNPLAPMEYQMFQRLEKVPRLLSRDDFTAVATACFLRTVLPAPYTQLMNCAMQVREVVNVHTFFRALETWKTIGYPSHILADLVEQILENRLERSTPPHLLSPVPIAGRKKPLVPICTVPFLAEFEVAAALWEARLFPISSNAAIPDLSDIRRYTVKIPREENPARKWSIINDVCRSPTHMVLLMVFGLPKDMDATSMDVRSKIVKARSWTSSLQFVSTFDYDFDASQCTVLLSKKRMDTFITEGYEAGLVNASGWMLQSVKIPCSAMKDVGDVDSWDKTLEAAAVKGRKMSNAQANEWMRSFSRGRFAF